MPAIRDLSGQTFGRLTVVGRSPISHRRAHWHCRCECGREVVVISGSLVQGKTRSCGCLNREARTKKATHGMGGTPIYAVWVQMIKRCGDTENPRNRNHAGRGINVCERWKESFQAFFDDMGPRPSPRHQIDRIEQDGDYEPSNCRWVTPKENANNKRNNHMLTAFGETKTLMEWSEDARCLVSYDTMKMRLNRDGWDAESAMSRPPVDPCGEPVTAFGETKSMPEWSRDPRCKTDYNTIKVRIRRKGWEPERAISTPTRKMTKRINA